MKNIPKLFVLITKSHRMDTRTASKVTNHIPCEKAVWQESTAKKYVSKVMEDYPIHRPQATQKLKGAKKAEDRLSELVGEIALSNDSFLLIQEATQIVNALNNQELIAKEGSLNMLEMSLRECSRVRSLAPHAEQALYALLYKLSLIQNRP